MTLEVETELKGTTYSPKVFRHPHRIGRKEYQARDKGFRVEGEALPDPCGNTLFKRFILPLLPPVAGCAFWEGWSEWRWLGHCGEMNLYGSAPITGPACIGHFTRSCSHPKRSSYEPIESGTISTTHVELAGNHCT